MNDAELTFRHEWEWDQRRHQHAAGDDKICREDGWHWCQSFWKVSGCSWIEFRKGTEDWNIEQSNTFYIVQVANSLVGRSGFKLLSAMLLRWNFSMTKSVLLTAMPVSNDIADTLLFLSWRLKISWVFRITINSGVEQTFAIYSYLCDFRTEIVVVNLLTATVTESSSGLY